MPKAKNVTVIPATLNIHTKTPTKERVRRRVAAYARVSTDSEEQLTSYEAQVDYYTRFIIHHWMKDFIHILSIFAILALPLGTQVCRKFWPVFTAVQIGMHKHPHLGGDAGRPSGRPGRRRQTQECHSGYAVTKNLPPGNSRRQIFLQNRVSR